MSFMYAHTFHRPLYQEYLYTFSFVDLSNQPITLQQSPLFKTSRATVSVVVGARRGLD